MKLIAGLGNPTEKYEGTRHNTGFMVIDALAEKLGVAVNKHTKNARVGIGLYRGERVLLAKPQTYMNLSGESLRPLMDYYGIEPEDVLVIVDDINLQPGSLRLRAGGSAGGHNGLKSIIAHLGTDRFPRLRVGVGANRGDLVDHVLGHFSKEERPLMEEAIGLAADAAAVFIAEGITEAMNRYNGSRKKEEHGSDI